MSIGIIDGDIRKYAPNVSFNLDVMKISSFLKKKLEVVSFIEDFYTDKYSQIYYRQDYYDGFFPPQLYTSNQIIYGGRAFTQDKYVPLPEEIEVMQPDINIYEHTWPLFNKTTNSRTNWKQMMAAAHLRISLDGENIWEDFSRSLTINKHTNFLFFHDYNLNSIKNSDILITELDKQLRSNIGHICTKFPIIVNNERDLFRWINIRPSRNYFLIQYDGIMSDECLYEFVNQVKHQQIINQMQYNVTFNLTEGRFIRQLPKIYKQLIFLRQNGLTMRFVDKYDNLYDYKWRRFLILLTHFLNKSLTIDDKEHNSIMHFIRSLPEENFILQKQIDDFYTKSEIRQIWRLIGQENYELLELIYRCEKVKYRGGYFYEC